MSRDKQNIKTTDGLTRGMTEAELAKEKEEAIKESEAELREKQIEKMAELICDNKDYKGICSIDGCVCDHYCEFLDSAEILYTAGYRKSTELAEEIFAEIDSCIFPYSTHDIFSSAKYAELKKKYESEKENG